MTDSATCDVLVIGSGAGGLVAAVTAGTLGLDVLVVEKTPWFGGTTAVSGGWLWIPCNPLAVRAGVDDSLDNARTYLKHETGNRYDEERIEAFLRNGPAMVEFFQTHTDVAFMLGGAYPDYHPDLPGSLPGGRAICAEAFDGRRLGDRLSQLLPPVRELTLFGLKVGSDPDFRHFFNARRSPRSAWYVARRIASHLREVIVYGRDVRLMNGNALIGRLVASAFRLNIPIRTASPVTALLVQNGHVVGATARRASGDVTIVARRGVVCATGGFPHDPVRRDRLFPHIPTATGHCSLAAAGDTGDGLRMAEEVGAVVEDNCASPAAWMPVSRVPRGDGTFGVYPHSFERGKPGAIAVTSAGARFANESDSYHDVVEAMLRVLAKDPGTGFFLVCDDRFIKRYGLGIAKPFPIPIETPPFYGVRILPGDLGTFAGLRTNGCAQVQDRDGSVIPGLYAAGTDMTSIFAGSYPGPGANLGPAMTFGFVCARHMAGLAS